MLLLKRSYAFKVVNDANFMGVIKRLLTVPHGAGNLYVESLVFVERIGSFMRRSALRIKTAISCQCTA